LAGTWAAIEAISAVAGALVVAFVDFDVVEVELDPQPVIATAASVHAAIPSLATLRRIVFLLISSGSVPPGRERIGEAPVAGASG
jgi:hypothetical protein